MDTAPPPAPLTPRRAFLVGFAVMLACCTIGTVVLTLSCELNPPTQVNARSVSKKADPAPKRNDVLEAARSRLRRLTGCGDLVFPFPKARLVVCKEYRELDLFSGERFVKRYHMAPLAPMATPAGGQRAMVVGGVLPEGTFNIIAHEPPDSAGRVALGLCAARPDSGAPATAPAPGRTPAAGRVVAVGTSPNVPDAAMLSIQGPGEKGKAPGRSIELTADEVLEIHAATNAGDTVVIEQ